MRYTITSSQLNHLRKEGVIEYAPLYKPGVLKPLLDEALTTHESGRDLERNNPPLAQALKLSMLGQIARDLFHTKRVKLAFTQYNPPYGETFSLSEISSTSEVIGCALISLEGEEMVHFYMPDHPIDFPAIEGPTLLIAFAKEMARYTIQENDPHTHFLKKLGYSSGDHLTEETHPLIAK